MERLSAKKKASLVRLYLSGLSYDEIAVKSGTSKGTVANVVAELKAGTFPEAADAVEQIELLRELSLDLKRSGLSPGQCAVGLAVLNRVKECGLDASDVDRLPLIIKAAGGEEKAKEFVDLVYRIQAAQRKSGLTLEQAEEKLRKMAAQATALDPVLKELERHRKEVVQLVKRRDELTPMVNSLEQKYGFLNPRIKDLEKREGELLQRIKDQQDRIDKAEMSLAALSHEKQDTIQKTNAAIAALGKEEQKLREVGFSLETLVEFNGRANTIAVRHHIAASELKNRLFHEMETLDKGLGLETLIQSGETELKKYQQAITSAKNEYASLKASIATLEQQNAALEATIKTNSEKITAEVTKVIPVVREAALQLVKELQVRNEEVLDEVKHLKDQALEVGAEIGLYEGTIKDNQWLIDLGTLVRGGDIVEAPRVRTIMLQVLYGGVSWMKRNQTKIGFGTPIYAMQKLIEELEKWQVQQPKSST